MALSRKQNLQRKYWEQLLHWHLLRLIPQSQIACLCFHSYLTSLTSPLSIFLSSSHLGFFSKKVKVVSIKTSIFITEVHEEHYFLFQFLTLSVGFQHVTFKLLIYFAFRFNKCKTNIFSWFSDPDNVFHNNLTIST